MTTETTMTCQCCGGDLPPRDAWEANRGRAGDCTGSVDPATGRCRAFADDALWQAPDVTRVAPDAE